MMLTALHSAADAVIKRIHRSPLYYRKYNNTLSFRINKSYIAYARECSVRYAEEHGVPDLPPSPLTEKPAIAFHGVFPAEKARALSAKMGELIERKDACVFFPPHKQGGGLMAEIRSPLKILGADALDVLRAPAVHQALLQFFRGNYRVKGAAAWRSFATNVADCVSWLWHSDTYPPFTCKLFLHLSPANAEKGATEFMNREDTMAYRRAGYFGQFSDERRGDLEVFAKEHGLPYRPIRINVEAGDATLFDQNFFHRAVAPRSGYRDVVQFLLLPSPISWEEDYSRNPTRLLTAEGGFPKDPRHLEGGSASSMMS
jgi:hypothetical protein